MNTYNMDKMYESYADTVERMQMWLDESEQENKKYKEVIDRAVEYLETHKRKDEFLELNQWGTRELLKILRGEINE